MKKHTIVIRKKAPKRASAVVDAVVTPAKEAARSMSVVLEYGDHNIRTFSFAANRGLKALKKHIKETCVSWSQAKVELPKGNTLVFRNPQAIRVLS